MRPAPRRVCAPRGRPQTPLTCPPLPRLTPRTSTPRVGALERAFDLTKGKERRAEGRSGDGVALAGWASAQVPVGEPMQGPRRREFWRHTGARGNHPSRAGRAVARLPARSLRPRAPFSYQRPWPLLLGRTLGWTPEADQVEHGAGQSRTPPWVRVTPLSSPAGCSAPGQALRLAALLSMRFRATACSRWCARRCAKPMRSASEIIATLTRDVGFFSNNAKDKSG